MPLPPRRGREADERSAVYVLPAVLSALGVVVVFGEGPEERYQRVHVVFADRHAAEFQWGIAQSPRTGELRTADVELDDIIEFGFAAIVEIGLRVFTPGGRDPVAFGA